MRGCCAGAKAANHASVLLGSLAAPAQLDELASCAPASADSEEEAGEHSVFSSAVPVLPATNTPGTAAAVPVPLRTTSTIRWRTVRATCGLITGTPGAGRAPSRNVGWGRRPPSAIVAATIAICRALA